jgi:hypothetical protein
LQAQANWPEERKNEIAGVAYQRCIALQAQDNWLEERKNEIAGVA